MDKRERKERKGKEIGRERKREREMSEIGTKGEISAGAENGAGKL